MCFNIVPKCSECRARPCSATICGGSLPLAARVMTSRVCRYRRGVPIMGTQWKTQSCVAKVVQVHASSKSSKSKPRISATPLPSVVLPASGRRNVPSANTQPQPPPHHHHHHHDHGHHHDHYDHLHHHHHHHHHHQYLECKLSGVGFLIPQYILSTFADFSR